MSKTTKRYGKPLMVSRPQLQAVVEVNEEQLKQQRFLNRVSQALFKGAMYHSLTDKQRTILHYTLNSLDAVEVKAYRELLSRKGLV